MSYRLGVDMTMFVNLKLNKLQNICRVYISSTGHKANKHCLWISMSQKLISILLVLLSRDMVMTQKDTRLMILFIKDFYFNVDTNNIKRHETYKI